MHITTTIALKNFDEIHVLIIGLGNIGISLAKNLTLLGAKVDGISKKEKNRFMKHPKTFSISLGPRILRADTAAISALTLWQLHFGDWAYNNN